MGKYIRYQIKNTEPIRIADDSASQLGQVATLRYIPGSTMKGLVINSLAAGLTKEKLRLLFFNKVRFLNAYMTAVEKKDGNIVERELLPSPKGFYEDKELKDGLKEIENVVVDGKFTEGNKRAALGRYCFIKDNTVHYYGVETSSDLKITLGNDGNKRNVFRNEYIVPGYYFTGYIAVEEDELTEEIKSVLSGDVYIGNARTAGLGKCRVLSCKETDTFPYETYAVREDQAGECYMMALSSLTMRGENGEPEGLNLSTLEKKMGVTDLKIRYCSTSMVTSGGYNRTLKSKTPSIHAYEQGSIFHLEYKGILTAETAKTLMEDGIGMNRNEGFGRILFLKNYEEVNKKISGGEEGYEAYEKEHTQKPVEEKEDAEVLRQVAKNYYKQCLEKAMIVYVTTASDTKSEINSSQKGIVEGLISANKYQPEEAVRVLENYFTHTNEKEGKEKVHKAKVSVKGYGKKILDMMEKPLAQTLNVKMPEKIFNLETKDLLTKEEELRMKQDLVLMMIRYENRKKEGK